MVRTRHAEATSTGMEAAQFLLLRASLQVCMAHLMRTVPHEALAQHMRRGVALRGGCVGLATRSGGVRHDHGGPRHGVDAAA